jgi:hypothetical protein
LKKSEPSSNEVSYRPNLAGFWSHVQRTAIQPAYPD